MVIHVRGCNFSTANSSRSGSSVGTATRQTTEIRGTEIQKSKVGRRINLLAAQRREQHILTMVLSMVSCYMLCWMPYGIMAPMATFGRSGLVTPVASVVPSVLAKFSTVINPVIYMFFNNQFYRCFVAFMKCSSEPQSVQGEEHPTPRTPFSGFFLVHRQASLRSSQRQILSGSESAALCSRHDDRHTLVVHYTP